MSILVVSGSVRVYDLESKAVMCHARYSSGGSALLWPLLSGDSTLIAGFQDGVVRYSRYMMWRSHE